MNKITNCWQVLLLQYFKRDWKKIIVWVAALTLLCAYIPAIQGVAAGQGAAGLFETLKNPAMISIVGPTPVTNVTDYTLGAMYSHMMLLFTGLIAMIVAALHVINHTRKEEELGLSEMIRSFKVGRQANSIAVIIETLIINIILASITIIIMLSFNIPSMSFNGALLYGVSIASAGFIGAMIALLFSQIMPTSAGAIGTSIGLIGLLYILRGVTDITDYHLSMFNPLGWIYLTFPFTENNWLPIGYALIFGIILILISFKLESSRDLKAGFIPEFEGREYAKKSLLSIRGLFLRRSKGTIIAWLIVFVVLGATYGSIYGNLQDFLNSNEMMKQMFLTAGVSIEGSFTATITMVICGIAAILPILIINKLFSEEARAYLSQIFSTKVSRTNLYFTTITIAIIFGIIGIILSSVSLGVVALVAMQEASTLQLSDFILAGINFIPALLLFVGLAAFFLGIAPTIGKAVYIYLTYAFMISYFGKLMNLPELVIKTSIFEWIPKMPIESFNLVPFLGITIISIILICFGYLGYKKRDFIENS